jgi:hypothetical protein
MEPQQRRCGGVSHVMGGMGADPIARKDRRADAQRLSSAEDRWIEAPKAAY